MPTIQAAAIATICQQDIEPLIVVIKFKNEFDCTYVMNSFTEYLIIKQQ